ncbi:MAG: ArdC-like ssDNA-binding domain-containing protein [Thermoplasmata archaeon]
MSYKNEDKKDKIKEITDKLEQGIKDIYDSEQYKNYLIVMSKFHSYSYRNSLLIMLQKPDATYVAGFQAWKNNFKRCVNKGEKGIQILAPAPYRVKVKMQKIDPITQKPILDNNGNTVTEEVEITKPAFKPVYVFDISQTSGRPLPQLTTELSGNIEQYEAFFDSLKSISPYSIQFEDIHGGVKGYCDTINQKIVLKKGMSEIQNIKTAIHEIAHADLHSNDTKDRKTREVEAESVAFVVCNHFGIDTSDYSFAYIASWSSDKDLQELKNSLDTIQNKAADLIDRIDTKFRELLKEKTLDKQKTNKEQAFKIKKNKYLEREGM